MKKMLERIEKELNGLAKRLNIEVEEMTEKYTELAGSSGLDLDDERQQLMAMSMTRQYVRSRLSSNRSNNSQTFGEHITGFFAAVEPVRDIMEYKRKSVLSRYNSDSSQTLTDELVAEITLEDGNYLKTQVRNGEWETKTIPSVPDMAIEISETTWIVPIDAVKTWQSGDTNKNYGKPLPKEQHQVRAHFIGQKEGGETQLWTVQLKNEMAKNFKADCFRMITFYGLVNEDRNAIYGIRNKTEFSQYIDSLDDNNPLWFDTSSYDYEEALVENMAEYVTDLYDLEDYHQEIQTQQGLKVVVTDGIVTSMNLKANPKTGNRVIWVEPLDANYGFDDEDMPDSTPVWVPSHVDLNFGVGSDIVVIGRTNQTQRKDESGMPIDGEYNPVSINLYGLRVRLGTGLEEEVSTDDGDSLSYW
ncbi:hypothetical protein [Altibacter sp.]|uniref:hypothetical protein n=1 Tax=Altibacter sp. TaxID=2024823 RepID=UPI0025C23AF9|nr:hypothetical protein [Altibacter sp.]